MADGIRPVHRASSKAMGEERRHPEAELMSRAQDAQSHFLVRGKDGGERHRAGKDLDHRLVGRLHAAATITSPLRDQHSSLASKKLVEQFN